jgi:multidrug transporter EmrE-like cation transporter
MGYLFLILTILSESAAVICMKFSEGFNNKIYTVIAIVTYAASFLFLTLALKQLPAGLANGIWAGASTIIVAIAGILIFKEKMTTVQLISMALIAIGLVGLNINKATV